MKKWIGFLAVPLTMLLLPASAAAAASPSLADNQVDAVFSNLVEYHINKPTESNLVAGALKRASDKLAEHSGKSYSYPTSDDTLPELKARLEDWGDTCKCDRSEMERWAIEGMLDILDDPYTMYFSQQELRQFQESVENEVVGFGFRLRMVNEQPMIREVVDDSPAQKAGLKAGDFLVSVDGEPLKGKTFEQVFLSLKGEAGTTASFLISRPKEQTELRVVIKREVLEIPETHTQRFLDDIGYIGLDTFSSDAGIQFSRALASLTANGHPLRGLIVDLRDNGGGYLHSARDIASLFMEEGVLMYTVNRNDIEIATWVHNGRTVSYPVSVMVNELTASASEMLSGALQDQGIATLVGTQTFGKGSAQQVVPLADGNALKITLHEYFTPKHRVVNHVGLTPDLQVADEVGQVIASLQKVGVARFVLEEQDDQVVVNGVTFPSSSPLFQKETTGISMRAAVLKQMTGDQTLGEAGYVALSPQFLLEKGLQLEVGKDIVRLSGR